MKISFKEFKKNPDFYMEKTKKEPVIITKLLIPHTVMISYEIYKTLLEGAWAEKSLQYSDEKTKQIAKKNIEKEQQKEKNKHD